jgi:hypothetical protein
VLAYTRFAGSGTDGLQDLWVRDLDATDARLALSDLDWSPPVWWPSLRVGDVLITGGSPLQGYDVARGMAAAIPAWFDAVSIRPDGKDLAAFSIQIQAGLGVVPRRDQILLGPLGAQTVITGVTPLATDYMGPDLAVWGQRPSDGAAGLFRLSRADGTFTLLLPVLTAPPSPASDPNPFSCIAVEQPACLFFQVLGCADDTTPCAGTGRKPCAILFVRQAAAGTSGDAIPPPRTPAVYDVASGVETSLGGEIDLSGFQRAPDGRAVAWRDTSPAQNQVAVWNACTERVSRCAVGSGPDMSFVFTRWRADSGAVVSVPLTGEGPLVVTSLADGTCITPSQASSTSDVAFSRSADRLSWIEHAAGGLSTLWVGDGLGRAPQVVASDLTESVFSRDGRFAVVGHGDGSLGSVDLLAPAPTERPLTGPVGTWRLSGRRLLALTDWNTQDLAGRLELFDLQTGLSTVMVQPVTDFAVSGSLDDAGPLTYVVHARFPSERDGLWLTMLPAIASP